MDGGTLFGLIFILCAIGGLLYAGFVELGGWDIIAKKMIDFIDSRVKRDI